MSITSRISAMQEHLTDDYSVLELAGADLTNVDKNIENLKQSWEERLLYFLANGTDVVWNNWLPKVTGSGTEISLNNTIEAKMDFVYKGNTYQYSTSGKNKSHFDRISLNGITFEGNDIDVINPTNYVYASEQWNLRNNSALSGKTYTIYSLANGTTGNRPVTLEIGTTSNWYAYQHQLSANTTYNNNLKVQAVTLGANDVFSKIDIYIAGSTTANINIKVMVVEGNYTAETIGDYEPYTNGASPNPDYPQDIQVVSGDNTIKVEGKNLFDKDNPNIIHKHADNSTHSIQSGIHFVTTYLPAKEGETYTISSLSNLFDNYACIFFTDSEPSTATTFLSNTIRTSASVKYITSTAPSGTKYVCFYMIYSTNQSNINSLLETIQIEKGTTATTYEPYQSQSSEINLGNIELCKIGDYQDSIKKSTGKNLFNSNISNYSINSDGSYNNGTDRMCCDYEKISGDKITFSTICGSGFFGFAFYDSNKNYISREIANGSYYKITRDIPNNTVYVRAFIQLVGGETATTQSIGKYQIMVELGSTATPYEPYGKVWYLNKQTGKIVYNGSESGSWTSSTFGGFTRFAGPIISNAIQTASRYEIKSNYFHYLSSGGEVGAGFIYAGQFFAYPNQTITTEQNFRNWLSTHNTTVYYVLATPTYEEITDTTLISQLEAIKKSYNTQTNISQTNADKPFILDVVALGELD